MDARAWHPVVGVDPEQSEFPAAATIEDAEIVVFRTATGYRATGRACPHLHADMVGASLAGNGTMVRCPMHAFTFRLADGKGVNCPGFTLRVYEIVKTDGALHGRAA